MQEQGFFHSLKNGSVCFVQSGIAIFILHTPTTFSLHEWFSGSQRAKKKKKSKIQRMFGKKGDCNIQSKDAIIE